VRKPAPRRKAGKVVTTSLLVLLSLALAAVGFVAGSASASPEATTTQTNTTKTTTTPSPDSIPQSPADHYFVLYGTANAASDHEIVGSSAFPNYTHGAVDNYYSMTHSHVDNSPFAEGTASPADTGPVGQTAAAGNFQQPQYADARWPGDPGKAAYGSKGGPYAAAEASDYNATAEASEASNGLSGPTAPSTMAAPKGFDGRLRLALAAWKAKWQSRPGLKAPAGAGTVKTPTATVKTPTATVPTPIATVTTPTVTVGGLQSTLPVPTPPVTAPVPTVPSTSARSTTTSSRSLASSSSPADGESLLESSTLTHLDPKTNALVTSGESRLGRVSLGGGQIVIEGIHVSATITNDGTPTYKAAVSIASASIGGVPVTIDQDGVHIAGQGQGVPYKQASDSLNGALKQAGIQLFLVGPEVATGSSSCDQTGTGTGTTTTASSDQTGTSPTTSSCDQSNSCGQTGTATGPTTTTPTPTTTSSNQTGTTPTTSSCDQTNSCSQTSTATGTTTTTTTTSNAQTGTTPTTSSWCDQTGMTTPTSSCKQTGKTTTTSSNDQTGTTTDTTTTTSSSDQTDAAGGTSTGSGEETITATGLHVVFTQPIGQSGVPAQNAEHILGEVFLDSLAVPAGPLPDLNLNLNFSGSSSSSCLGGRSGRTKTSGLAAAGGSSSSGGATSSGSLSPSASGFTSGSNATGGGVPTSLAALASLLRSKPLWLLLAYLVWQTLAVVTGVSLWNWRRGAAS
jgi:hypothetical protein